MTSKIVIGLFVWYAIITVISIQMIYDHSFGRLTYLAVLASLGIPTFAYLAYHAVKKKKDKERTSSTTR